MASPELPSARIAVHLRPRSSRDELVEMRGEVLVARVSAPPVDDRANAALRRLLAKATGVAPSRVRLVAGEHARQKVVEIAGLTQAQARAALARSTGSGTSR
ncbi:MAG: DUF167 domain-containing protein [Solirubrobacteraceae bacterium]